MGHGGACQLVEAGILLGGEHVIEDGGVGQTSLRQDGWQVIGELAAERSDERRAVDASLFIPVELVHGVLRLEHLEERQIVITCWRSLLTCFAAACSDRTVSGAAAISLMNFVEATKVCATSGP